VAVVMVQQQQQKQKSLNLCPCSSLATLFESANLQIDTVLRKSRELKN